MKRDWKTLAAKLFCFGVFGLLAYAFMKYIFSYVFPFLIAFAIASFVARLARRASALTGVSVKLCAFFFDTIILCAVGVSAFFICRNLVLEISELLPFFSSGKRLSEVVPVSLKAIPMFGDTLEYIENMLGAEAQKLILSVLSAMLEIFGGVIGKVIKGGPSVLLSGIVCIISIYYMSMDMQKVRDFARSLIPSEYVDGVKEIGESVLSVVCGYLRAYVSLFALTFCETLIALIILCPRYAFIAAIGIAAVDILPVFGAGAVLIPWGIFKLVCGDIFVGVGLLVTYVIITVIRQIAEPKIIGKRIGIPPFVALIAMFFGTRLWGITGMLLTPMLVAIALNVLCREANTSKNIS